MDDEDLDAALRAAQSGDAHGFARLWRALQPTLLRYLQVVVGDAAEDVASETWLQVVRNMGEFRGGGTAFRVWLFRIARNRGIDQRRMMGRRREEVDDDAAHDHRSVPDAAHEVLDGLGTAWALRVIASLPPDQAEAIMLRVVAGLDVAQAAQVLGKRPGAVRIAAMRGLRRLANHDEVRAREAARRSGPVTVPVVTRRPRPREV